MGGQEAGGYLWRRASGGGPAAGGRSECPRAVRGRPVAKEPRSSVTAGRRRGLGEVTEGRGGLGRTAGRGAFVSEDAVRQNRNRCGFGVQYQQRSNPSTVVPTTLAEQGIPTPPDDGRTRTPTLADPRTRRTTRQVSRRRGPVKLTPLIRANAGASATRVQLRQGKTREAPALFVIPT